MRPLNSQPIIPQHDDSNAKWKGPSTTPGTFREVAGGTILFAYAGLVGLSLLATFTIAYWPTLCAIAFAAFLSRIFVKVARELDQRKQLTLSACAASLICGVMLIAAITAFNVVAIKFPGLVVSALYGLTFALGAWKIISRLEQVIAGLVAIAALAISFGVIVIPGTEQDKDFTPPPFKITVFTRDLTGTPLENALVNCSVFDAWRILKTPQLTADPKISDQDGKSGPWTFPFRHPLKAVLCAATIHSKSDEPAWSEKNEIRRGIVYLPLPAGDYRIDLYLNRPIEPVR